MNRVAASIPANCVRTPTCARQKSRYSLGTKSQSNRYNSKPAPAQTNSAVNISRHTHASIPVDRAMPPHTPPNHRSVRLRLKELTADTTGSLERACSEFSRRSLARTNSSSVRLPDERSSASLLSSSPSVIVRSSCSTDRPSLAEHRNPREVASPGGPIAEKRPFATCARLKRQRIQQRPRSHCRIRELGVAYEKVQARSGVVQSSFTRRR